MWERHEREEFELHRRHLQEALAIEKKHGVTDMVRHYERRLAELEDRGPGG